jgi:hypothetical protein
MKTLQQQETEAILAMGRELEELRAWKEKHLQTSKNIVEFVKNNPPSYKVKVAEAPKHIGYES